ncbi:hypothetical protein EVB39_039 [Rhizobium phage RHph_TM3_3_9]|nr:hypothetical protein EVB39_039 [Rhizobium phage RHph_TM3_3_9]QIG67846.1 hypothetical protein EVB53_044 [Rhizobium phage RHph_Y60]QIG68560.1 hypothetical protein EVB66_039 [Rhizobium phage RHph_TM3_3_13]QIG74418.1 hypothetical protein EVC09_038 [Rhizobium phage RHph_TM3_3_10]QXV74532.1 hypothetical protein [Rhizobium phage RHEph19]
MSRLPDWHSRFVAFIDEMRRTPFQWGNDCGPAFAGRCVTVLTGKPNPVEKYIGAYTTRAGAIRAMKEVGFTDLKQAVESFLGEPSHPSAGFTGDIACVRDNSPLGYALGIVNGERIFFRRPDGIGTLGLLDADSVFKI